MLYDCDRCMFTFRKKNLRRQRGMLLCDACFDTTLEIEPINVRWRAPRSNSTSYAAETGPTVLTVTTAGITTLSKSQTKTREGANSTVPQSYELYVVGAPTTITANPQIVAGASGTQGTFLTLIGTSDTNYVTIKAGNGTDLAEDMVLRKDNVITLVYNTASSLWCETSRSMVGGFYG